ncbi:MAG: type II toxin-antitoxin system HicB family antitoxin [Patescibacteria group bacterium]
MKYTVILRKSKYGYDVHVPAFPGCHSQGKTEKEALENIGDAIKTYIGMDLAETEGTNVKVRELEIAAG